MLRKLFFLMAVVLLSQVAFAELVFHCKFDGDANNVCNSELGSKICGSVKYADGISGQCLDLTAAGDNAIVFDGSEKVVNGLNAFSVCFWYKGNLKDNSPWASLVSKNGENDEGWQVRFNDYEGGGCFTVRGIKDVSGNCMGYAQIADNCMGYAQIADGQWHHIAGVFDGEFIYLYVDGILEDIEDAAGRCGTTNSPIVIGAKIAKGKKEPYAFSKGMFDELRIYDNALDKQQIKQLGSYDRVVGEKFIDEYCRLGTYPIQAHRGGGSEAPEHTLETYRQTWDRHIVPEADVRTTSDDVIVCFHDTDLKRICPNMPTDMAEKGIGQMTLEEVKKLDVGAFRGKPGQKVPTLDEVFKEMSGRPERFIYLDYKHIDMQRLAEMVKKYGIEKQVIFTNKSHNLIMQWKRLILQSQTLLWTGGSQQAIAKKLESLRMEDYRGITMLQFHYRKRDDGYNLSDEFLLKAKKELDDRGIIFQVLPWKRNDSEVYEKLLDLGIRSFATDYPGVILPVYEKKMVKGK